MANVFGVTWGFTMSYVQQVADNIVDVLDNCVRETAFNKVVADVNANTTTLGGVQPQFNNLMTQVTNLSTQMNQLPVSAQSLGGTRQFKISKPPEFDSTDGKIKFQEWINKIHLWFVHEGIVTDRHHIAVAMNKLSSSAAQYMEP